MWRGADVARSQREVDVVGGRHGAWRGQCGGGSTWHIVDIADGQRGV